MCFSFFFNDTATTEIYTLSLPDALPISGFTQARLAVLANRLQHAEANTSVVFLADEDRFVGEPGHRVKDRLRRRRAVRTEDRKSTRLNSSHDQISYAVFCLKKQKYTMAA